MGSNGYWDQFWKRRASRRTLLKGSAVGAAGLAAAIALGCGGEEEEGTPAGTATPTAAATLEPEFASAKYGGVMNFDQSDEPITFDNHIEEPPGSIHAANLVYNHLVKLWQDYERERGVTYMGPELAAKWEQPDQLTYRFSLVQNAKFHNLPPLNGRLLTSADVKYSLERMIDPNNPELRTRSSLDAIDKVETPDKFTVVVKTKFPFAPFLFNVGHTWAVIMGPELAETPEVRQRGVGTGPFIFKNWQRGVQLNFDRNPEYWRTGHPFVQKFVMRIAPDAAARMASFRTGETDYWASGPPTTPLQTIDDLAKSVPDARRFDRKGSEASGLKTYFNTREGPFKDKRLRQVFLYGFDYERLLKMFGGIGDRNGPLPLGIKPWGLKPEEVPPQDMDKAKALLAEAGYGPDKPLKTTTKISNQYTGPQTAQIVQQFMKPLGVEIEIKQLENAEWIQKVYRGGQDYEMGCLGDWSWQDPDRGLYPYFHSQGVANRTHYNNPEADRLLEAQRREFDLQKRIALSRQLQLLLIDDAPEVWLGSLGAVYLVRGWLKNFKIIVGLNGGGYRQWDDVWYDPMPPGRSA